MTGGPVRDLTRDELDDLLGAWAVDALDEDDRIAVEAAAGPPS